MFSSVVEQFPYKEEVIGSNPITPKNYFVSPLGGMADALDLKFNSINRVGVQVPQWAQVFYLIIGINRFDYFKKCIPWMPRILEEDVN